MCDGLGRRVKAGWRGQGLSDATRQSGEGDVSTSEAWPCLPYAVPDAAFPSQIVWNRPCALPLPALCPPLLCSPRPRPKLLRRPRQRRLRR